MQVKSGKLPGKGEFERLTGEDRAKNTITKTRNAGQNKKSFHLNRFGNILPYDAHRVRLRIRGDGDHDYINASWIGAGVIAAQGPTRESVDNFWLMVADEGVQNIVMLTRSEKGTSSKVL